MPRNLELKAAYPYARGKSVAGALKARFVSRLFQTDTYFRVPRLRLKLREIRGKPAELILYDRPDAPSARISQYSLFRIERPHSLKSILHRALGSMVTVRKRRDLYLYRNARIHLDRVAGLGSYIEFEVIVRYGMRQARQLMRLLMRSFGITADDGIAGSYSTMVQKAGRGRKK